MPYWSLAAVLKMLSATQGKQQEIRHHPQPSLPGTIIIIIIMTTILLTYSLAIVADHAGAAAVNLTTRGEYKMILRLDQCPPPI